MPETFYRTGTHDIDHTSFGGIINPSDFNTDYRGKDNTSGSPVAGRIINDWKFDEQCRKNKENNIREKNWRKQKNA